MGKGRTCIMSKLKQVWGSDQLFITLDVRGLWPNDPAEKGKGKGSSQLKDLVKQEEATFCIKAALGMLQGLFRQLGQDKKAVIFSLTCILAKLRPFRKLLSGPLDVSIEIYFRFACNMEKPMMNDDVC